MSQNIKNSDPQHIQNDSGDLHPASGPVAEVPPTSGKNSAPKPETGGPSGPEPTRYGDWERNGRCVDF